MDTSRLGVACTLGDDCDGGSCVDYSAVDQQVGLRCFYGTYHCEVVTCGGGAECASAASCSSQVSCKRP